MEPAEVNAIKRNRVILIKDMRTDDTVDELMQSGILNAHHESEINVLRFSYFSAFC